MRFYDYCMERREPRLHAKDPKKPKKVSPPAPKNPMFYIGAPLSRQSTPSSAPGTPCGLPEGMFRPLAPIAESVGGTALALSPVPNSARGVDMSPPSETGSQMMQAPVPQAVSVVLTAAAVAVVETPMAPGAGAVGVAGIIASYAGLATAASSQQSESAADSLLGHLDHHDTLLPQPSQASDQGMPDRQVILSSYVAVSRSSMSVIEADDAAAAALAAAGNIDDNVAESDEKRLRTA